MPKPIGSPAPLALDATSFGDAVATSPAPFQREPLRLGSQPLARNRSQPMSQTQLADAHWLVVTIAIEASNEAWAWAIPIAQDAPDMRIPPENFLDTTYAPCERLLDSLKEQIESKAFDPDGELELGYHNGAQIRDIESHPTARIMTTSLPIKGRDPLGQEATLPAWIDQGLRTVFPFLPPMQGPYFASILKAAEFTLYPRILGESPAAKAQRAQDAADAKDRAHAILQRIPSIARVAMEAQDIEAAAHAASQPSEQPLKPRL